jgi:hypothetical protein
MCSVHSFFHFVQEKLPMTNQSMPLIAQLKGLGFARGKHMKLYGQKLKMISDPIVVTEDRVVVEAVEEQSGQAKRLPIPLPILRMKKGRAA